MYLGLGRNLGGWMVWRQRGKYYNSMFVTSTSLFAKLGAVGRAQALEPGRSGF